MQLWDTLEPMIQESCEANEISKGTLSGEAVLSLAAANMCTAFLCSKNQEPEMVIVIQIFEEDDRKLASVLALAGKDLLSYKRRYWSSILQWLKDNGVKFLDALANPRMANIYLRKYGFTKSCVCVRMEL